MSGEDDGPMLMTRCVVVLPRVREDSASPSDLYKHQDQAKWGGISESGAAPIWGHPRRRASKQKARRGVNQDREWGTSMRNDIDPAKNIGLVLLWRPDRKRETRGPRSISDLSGGPSCDRVPNDEVFAI